ncbi:hypothetical protein, partial [Klebsiella quasipneumoniae]|uniref:hypothetical protein n=1 Tax=Klebsiella quasipneumoniae TaxID=1463165 RepID=UPI002731A6C0
YDFKIIFFKSLNIETSLTVQRLRLCLPLQGLWVLYLAGELRSYMPCSKKPKHKIEGVVTNSTKTFKMFHIKKSPPKQKISLKRTSLVV